MWSSASKQNTARMQVHYRKCSKDSASNPEPTDEWKSTHFAVAAGLHGVWCDLVERLNLEYNTKSMHTNKLSCVT